MTNHEPSTDPETPFRTFTYLEPKFLTRIFLLTEGEGSTPVQLGLVDSFSISDSWTDKFTRDRRWHMDGFPQVPFEGTFQLISTTQIGGLTYGVHLTGCTRDSFHLHTDEYGTHAEISGPYVRYYSAQLTSENAINEILQQSTGMGH